MLSNIPVKLIFTLVADINILAVPNQSGSHTTMVKFIAGSFTGPELQGTLLPEFCSDVGQLHTDGSIKAEANLLLRTDDNAEVHMHYLVSP